MHFIQVSALVR